jgi:hypothetical protein
VNLLSLAPLVAVVHELHHALLVGGAAIVPVLAGALWFGARGGKAITAEEQRIAALRQAASEGALGSRLLLPPAPSSAPLAPLPTDKD